MALPSTLSDARTTTRVKPVRVAAAGDRDRSFRQARRHTLLVRLMRWLLPAAALLTLSAYAVNMRVNMTVAGGRLELPIPEISTKELTMSNPRYEGFNKDGSKFTVTAKTASQDIKQKGPIGLTGIDGRILQANNNTVTLTAPRGTYDNTAGRLELFEDIKIRSSDGMRADLTQATVLMKDNRVTSLEPVAIDMAAGQIRANSMDMLQAARQVTFANGVMTRLKPEPKAAGTSAKPATPASGQRMVGSGDGPVDVASRTLKVDDAKKTAIFTGDVVATQGEAALRAPEIQAYYDGTAVALPGATAPAGETAAPAGKLKRLVVPHDVTLTQGADRVTSLSASFDMDRETAVLDGNVTMTSGADRRVTSDHAEFNPRAETALLTGNVVVQQEQNVLRGGMLALDRKAGKTRLSTPGGRITARFVQAAPARPVAKTASAVAAKDASGFVFRTDPNAPIDIDAETLDIVEKAKTVTFRGAVRAAQGEFVIRTAELVATYSGEAGFDLPGAAAGDGKSTSAQVTRVRANQRVEVTSTDGQSATGDEADFDVKGNKVTLTGNVALKRGDSVAYTPKAIIDMATGVTYLEQQSKPAGPTVSFSPTEQRAPYVLPELPAKKTPLPPIAPPAFATNPAACPPGKTCLTIDPKDAGSARDATKPGAAKQPWQAGTTPAAKTGKAPEASGWTSQ
jgi:LPS export ABC transporter protein LptC/lipopolysaccharide transport protein LptA